MQDPIYPYLYWSANHTLLSLFLFILLGAGGWEFSTRYAATMTHAESTKIGSLSAYILFGQDERPKLAEKYPNLKQTEYMSKIGELWYGTIPPAFV